MITTRAKDFINTDSTDSIQTHTIDTAKVEKAVLEEIKDFESLKNSLDDDKKEFFEKIMKRCKDAEIMFEAKSGKIKAELDGKEISANMKEDELKSAKKTRFSSYMNGIAGITIIGIIVLMALSFGCVDWEMCTVDSNPYTKILESNFFIVLIGTVIAPIVSKYLKENHDIKIKSTQIAMITQDAIKTVSMYNNAANELRGDDGQLSDEHKEQLQNLALSSIKDNFGAEKYNELIANLSGQAFKKAIEYAVAQNKIKNFPLEQEQVEKIIKQSLDVVPHVIDWQKEDPKVKETFIRGYVKELLQNTGADGWTYNALEGIFDAEVNKRLAAAAIAEARKMIDKDETDPMKKYTSVIMDTVLASGIN